MNKSEVETVVLINRAEMEDGHFSVETTDRRVWSNITARLEGTEGVKAFVDEGVHFRAIVPASLISRLVTFWSK